MKESSHHEQIVPVRVDLDGRHGEMARYALESLLIPLGLAPRWVDSDEPGGEATVYYGRSERAAGAIVRLPCDPEALSVLEGSVQLDVSSASSATWRGEEWPALFRDPSGAADIVAGTFYLLAGTQEIVGHPTDRNGRFRFEDSVQHRLGFATRPAVDAYRERLAALLSEAGVSLRRRSWGGRTWALCPTFDVDYLWKWRKGMVYREIVRYPVMNDLGEPLAGRIRRLGQFARDFMTPGDLYRKALVRMIEEVRSRGGTATIFLKAGAHGPHDVTYSLRGGWLGRQLASARSAGFEVGVHPSYYAHTHGGYLAQEVEALEGALGVHPTSVRQHYLRYDPRITPDLHRAMGFEIDSTLGFPGSEGFRRSTCCPFRLFDWEQGRASDIWEMPLVVMDGTLFNRKGYSADEAIEVTKEILDQCRSYGGCAVLLWHNILWDELDAPGWGRHFLETLDYGAANGALIADLDSALDGWRRSLA